MVNIKGLKKLDANIFDQIIIEENNNVFLIDILGEEVLVCNDEFSRRIEDMSDEIKIKAIIQKYLDNFKINGVTSLIPVGKKNMQETIVYSQSGNKRLRMKISNPIFEEIYELFMNKYKDDRYNYFWNEDIKNLKLESSFAVSMYNKCDDYVCFIMNTNDHGSILYSERDFIESFLYYKFWQIGEEAKITKIYDEYSIDEEDVVKEYVIQCGDMRITFPNVFEFSFLFSFVNAYNIELFRIRNDEKKRQLKMEGF